MTEQTSAVRPAAAGPAGGAEAKLPPVTAIVPCYNAAATLERAAASILDGAPDNLQLILVDDGSADETPALCDKLAAGERRIRAIHQKNGGASAARNAGLDAAAGEWVLFVDADDALLPGLWDALPAAFAADPQLILFGMARQSGPAPCPLAPGFYPTPADLGDALRPLLFESGYLAAPYPKLFRLPALRAAGLRFDEGLKINEDVLFNTVFLQNSISIFCLSGVYYYQYDGQTGSLSRRLRGDLLDAEAYTAPALEAMLRRWGYDPAPYLAESRLRAALNQYGLLTGCRGDMPFGQRRALFARILADPAARDALRSRLRQDARPLLAVPYRIGVALNAPGWLAAYTLFKQRFL